MKYSVKFFPEKRKEIINGLPLVIEKNVPVLCSISWASKRIFYYTGKRCDLKQWDFKENKLAVKAVPIDGSNDIIRSQIGFNCIYRLLIYQSNCLKINR
jgi:hypothetical protein